LYTEIFLYPKPVIAALNGHTIAGGCMMALACDLRVIARGARFMVPELRLGINLGWQTIPRLVRLVGPALAKRIIILGEEMGAEQACDLGIGQELVVNGEALEAALNMAQKAAQMPPLPVRMTKQAVNAVTNALNHAASYMDLDQLMLCQMTEDYREAFEAFAARREPSFKGR